MGILDFLSGGGSIVESVGKVADELITSDEERLEKENEIKKAQMNYELENKKLDSEQYKAEAGDRDSARDRDARVNESANATWLSKSASSLNGLLVMIVFFGFAVMSVFDFGIPVRENAFNTVFMAVYGMATLYGGYLWGASKPMKSVVDSK